MATKQAITGSSTPDQRRAIVLAGQRLGMDVDELRSLTPAGSLRALSFEQASALLDRLNEGRRPEPVAAERKPRPRRPSPGVIRIISDRQREVIASYRDRLGWTDEHFGKFLQKTFGLTIATLVRRNDASRVITVLRRIVDHKVSKGQAEAAAE